MLPITILSAFQDPPATGGSAHPGSSGIPLGLKPKQTRVQAPWQNGIAERWVGSCRREILNHVIALNEQHLRRLGRDYVADFQEDRIHDPLAKDTPNRCPIENRPSPDAALISIPRLGGLHHRYSCREAA